MKKICIFTGSRAEYGLLKPLIRKLNESEDFTLQLLVSGMHLSPEFGKTVSEIEKDGLDEYEKVEILLSSDSPVGICKSMGLGLISYAEALNRLKPDMLVGLGDRFELFSVVSAAHVCRIPVAHIHGGELTEGAIDDAFRHSITKMSHIHFTSTSEYRNRVIQLGEEPSRVFNVGAIGLDSLKELKLLRKEELEKVVNFRFGKKNLLITYHPVTLGAHKNEKHFQNLLDALDEFEDVKLVFTKANADKDGRLINSMIDSYVAKRKSRASAYTSLGQLRYLSMMSIVDAVVGNSSSGIIEAPSYRVATINIGDRQKGRVRNTSVIDCDPNKKDICECINIVLEKKVNFGNNVYGSGDTARKIFEVLYKVSFSELISKKFYDVKVMK